MRAGGLFFVSFSFFFFCSPLGDLLVDSMYTCGLPLGALFLMNIFCAFIHKKKKKSGRSQ